jgi:hypothetical protein
MSEGNSFFSDTLFDKQVTDTNNLSVLFVRRSGREPAAADFGRDDRISVVLLPTDVHFR